MISKRAAPFISSKGNRIEVSFAHGPHVDISANPFLHHGEEGGIRVDRRTARCRPLDHTLRDGSPGLGIRAHEVSPGIPDGRKDLTAGLPDRDLKLPFVNNI